MITNIGIVANFALTCAQNEPAWASLPGGGLPGVRRVLDPRPLFVWPVSFYLESGNHIATHCVSSAHYPNTQWGVGGLSTMHNAHTMSANF